MQGLRFVYWQNGDDWLGYLEEYPDYLSQGTSLSELKEHLRDIWTDITAGHIPA